MGRTKIFRVGRRLVKVFNFCIHRRRRQRDAPYQLLQPSAGPISRVSKWVHSFRRGAKRLCSGISDKGYVRVGQQPVQQMKMPKGYLAVYVGDKEDDKCRVLVPVIYFNHPLFSELLREAEKVHGFNHPGGIQIPCTKSELENIQMKIAAAYGGGNRRR